MTVQRISSYVGIVFLVAALLGADWLRFRGPDGTGLAPGSKPPLQWNDTEGNVSSIAWKIELPGRGCSSPLVIGNQVFVTCSSGYRQDQLILACYDESTGERLWQRTLWATGRTMTHPTIAPAAPSPVSDGRRIFVSFSTNDIACFDLAGNLLWLRGLMIDYPNASNSLGLASSLVVADSILIAKLENDSQSLTVALNADDGTNRWRVKRPAIASWSTPVIRQTDSGSKQVILESVRGVTAYDLSTGKKEWEFAGACSPHASVCVAGNRLLVPARGLSALKPATGTQPEVLWDNNRLRCNTATPLVHGDRVFVISGTILKAADLKTGKLLWQLRLKGRRYSASPILAGGYLYTMSEDGAAQVIDISGKKGSVVGGGKLGETVLATPAVAHDALYVRSHQHLWKIAQD